MKCFSRLIDDCHTVDKFKETLSPYPDFNPQLKICLMQHIGLTSRGMHVERKCSTFSFFLCLNISID